MGGLILHLTLHALWHPRDAWALFVVGWRFRRNRWWMRVPFLPLPSTIYLRWRMYTAYGDANAVPPVADVLRYARWAVRIG